LQRALSIRQPLVELILIGKKTEEYRSRLTHIRERAWGGAVARVAVGVR